MPTKNSRRNALRANRAVRREVKMYAVYARSPKEDVKGEVPLAFVNRATLDIWIEQGSVRHVDRGRAYRMLLNEMPKTQQSISMGPGVVEGAAKGKDFAQVCALAWRSGWTPVMAANAVFAGVGA